MLKEVDEYDEVKADPQDVLNLLVDLDYVDNEDIDKLGMHFTL